MRLLLPLFVVVALSFMIDPVVRAFPKPSVNPVAWQLDFVHGTPQRVVVQAPGDAAPKPYWYMTFTVTNKTNEDQEFLPTFEMVDDKGNLHRSDKKIPKAVFDVIKQRERSKLMEPLGVVSGRLLPGVDQAKDSVAIWPEPQERMGTFQIYVTGLSGEAIWFKDGKETPMKKADWVKVRPEEAGQILRKTLELEFQVPGDEVYQGRDPVLMKKENWVMR